jgi:Flp pilus assembly protein TadB
MVIQTESGNVLIMIFTVVVMAVVVVMVVVDKVSVVVVIVVIVEITMGHYYVFQLYRKRFPQYGFDSPTEEQGAEEIYAM